MILDTKFLDELTAKAKENPRLRMNYNLHDSLDSKAQRIFNGLEPGAVIFEVKDGPYTPLTSDNILE